MGTAAYHRRLRFEGARHSKKDLSPLGVVESLDNVW
jgi:hypothetical protein